MLMPKGGCPHTDDCHLRILLRMLSADLKQRQLDIIYIPTPTASIRDLPESGLSYMYRLKHAPRKKHQEASSEPDNSEGIGKGDSALASDKSDFRDCNNRWTNLEDYIG